MSRQTDRQLLEELDTLGEIIEWLENRKFDDGKSSASLVIDPKELEDWLKQPTVEQARSWLKKKASASI